MDFRIPSEVWLIGKGPSIDTYDFDKSGWKCGINEVALMIPCQAAIAIDYNIQDKYRNTPLSHRTVVFQKDKHTGQYPYKNNSVVNFNYEKHCQLSMFSTAPIAIQVLWYCGARVFHFVGFDSFHVDSEDTKDNPSLEYAKSVKEKGFKGTNNTGFQYINKHIRTVISKLNLDPIWEHLDES